MKQSYRLSSLVMMALLSLGLLMTSCNKKSSSSGGGSAPAPAPAPKPQPGLPGTIAADLAPLSGEWSGSASDGRTIKFKVQHGFVVSMDVKKGCAMNATAASTGFWVDLGAAISTGTGKSFLYDERDVYFSGSFSDESTGTGHLQVRDGTACQDATKLSWSAKKTLARPDNPRFILTVEAEGLTSPSFEISEGIWLGSTDKTNSYLVEADSRVTLFPTEHFRADLVRFDGWKGVCSGVGPCELMMNSNINLKMKYSLRDLSGTLSGVTSDGQTITVIMGKEAPSSLQIDLSPSSVALDKCKANLTSFTQNGDSWDYLKYTISDGDFSGNISIDSPTRVTGTVESTDPDCKNAYYWTATRN